MSRRRQKKSKPKAGGRTSPPKRHTGPWLIHFFQRHRTEDPNRTVPARDFLDACPVAAKFVAVLDAVAAAPPPNFSGGGMWEAMHGDMKGFFEVRADGPNRHHYRLFCILERNGDEIGLGGPSIVLITGKDKPLSTKLSDADYAKVRRLGAEYRARSPRSVLQ